MYLENSITKLLVRGGPSGPPRNGLWDYNTNIESIIESVTYNVKLVYHNALLIKILFNLNFTLGKSTMYSKTLQLYNMIQ